MADPIDRGPAIQHRRGQTVQEDRPDPEANSRTVTGFRRMDGLRTMYNRGTISFSQWEAAERLRADLEFSAGARESQTDSAGIRSNVISYGPTSLQLDAIRRVRDATQAVGLRLAGILSWVVISGGTLEGYASAKSVAHETAKSMMVGALDKLADFYSAQRERE